MKIITQLNKLLTHTLNENQKIKTFFRIFWWKINQLFFKIPAVIQITKTAKLICYPDSSYGSFVVYAKFPEYEEMKFIESIIVDRDIVVDVGANIGAISVLAASKGKNVLVFAFEPTKKIIPLFLENVGINHFGNKIKLIEKAVADKNGKIEFILESESEINHIASSQNTKREKSISVDCITLDKFFKDNSLKKINFLKVDVEGAELLVFKGAKECFEKQQVEMILFELNENASYFKYTKNKIVKFLKKNSFDIYRFNQEGRLELLKNHTTIQGTTNLVAVLKNKKMSEKIKEYL